MSTVESIEEALVTRRYDPSFAPALQDFLKQQISTGVYSLDANVTLLKFYQRDPALATEESVGNILIKAMMALPSTDFLTCLFLIPERTQQLPSIAALISLARNLETANFAQFWSELDKVRPQIAKATGFEAAIRKFIFYIVSISYKSISKAELCTLVQLPAKDVDSVIQEQSTWKSVGSDVHFPVVPAVTGPKHKEHIDIEHVVPVLRKICK